MNMLHGFDSMDMLGMPVIQGGAGQVRGAIAVGCVAY